MTIVQPWNKVKSSGGKLTKLDKNEQEEQFQLQFADPLNRRSLEFLWSLIVTWCLMFTSGSVWFNIRSCAVGVSWQLRPTSGCNISTEETVNREKSSLCLYQPHQPRRTGQPLPPTPGHVFPLPAGWVSALREAWPARGRNPSRRSSTRCPAPSRRCPPPRSRSPSPSTSKGTR